MKSHEGKLQAQAGTPKRLQAETADGMSEEELAQQATEIDAYKGLALLAQSEA